MYKPLVTIKYKTVNGSEICVEVSTPVKELLEQSTRQIQSQRRQDRRYLDYTDFIDGYSFIIDIVCILTFCNKGEIKCPIF